MQKSDSFPNLFMKALRAIVRLFFLFFFQSSFSDVKSIPFHLYLFMKALIFVWFLLQKNEGNSDNKNQRGILTSILLIIMIVFSLQYNAILLHLESLKE